MTPDPDLTYLAGLTAPPLVCPFPVECHPRMDDLAHSIEAWAVRHGLLHAPRQHALFRAARWHLLGAMAYPRFPFPLLEIAGWLMAWIIMYDEAGFEQPAADGRYAETASHLIRCEMLFEDPDGPLVEADPYLNALREPLLALRREATAAQMRRFAAAFLRQLFGNACEVAYLAGRATATVQDYLGIRNHTAGAAPYAVLIDIGGGHRLSEETWASGPFQALLHVGGDLFGLENDITNHVRDRLSPRPFVRAWNIVDVLAHAEGLSLEEAFQRACALHRDRMDRCVSLCAQLDAAGDASLRAYVRDYKAFMAAPRAWYAQIERYKVLEEFQPPSHGRGTDAPKPR